MSTPARIGLSHYAGRAGDHNDRAMTGSRELAAALAGRFDLTATVVGSPEPPLCAGWAEELALAMPTLTSMAARLDLVFRAGQIPVTASSRCAVALATLPVVAAHRPDATVVWFDAHADLNTPASSTTGYLGGLAFSGPLGMWDSGLGAGLATENAILVGARDIDPPEAELIEAGAVTLVKVGPDLAENLHAAIAGRPIYLHVDCDVLDPGLVPTDYLVPDGMTFEDLHAAAEVLAGSEIVGVEIGELETAPDATTPRTYVADLLHALEPVLRTVEKG